jgi:hypothetical protein
VYFFDAIDKKSLISRFVMKANTYIKFPSIIALFLSCSSAFAVEIPVAECNESVFTPCVCSSAVPPEIKFRPRLAACGGNAAVILEDEWASSYSVVLRDRLNRDRYPSSGYNGCTASEAGGVAPPNRCSAFKVQKKVRRGGAVIHCFGNRGADKILAKASRLTIKLKDVPGSSSDPLARICLNGFNTRVNLN